MTIAEQLAREARELSFDELPAEVIHQVKSGMVQPDGSGGFLGLALLDDQPTNQGGWRDIRSKDLTCVMRTEVTFLSSFTFLVVKSAGLE